MNISKNHRVLQLYVWLENGKCVNIEQIANDFGVDVRTIQRDIADIRAFLADQMIESGVCKEIVYDRGKNVYFMTS